MRGRPWVPLGVDLTLDGQPCWSLYSIIPCFIVIFFHLLNASEDLVEYYDISDVKWGLTTSHQNMAIADGCPPSPKHK